MSPHLTFTVKSWKFMVKKQRADNMQRNGVIPFSQAGRMSKTASSTLTTEINTARIEEMIQNERWVTE
ncbi:hypothetical protein TNCV_4976941 [Trichonephila clavipes]|nr:hypothetical protein TNCV_4976941 [Trichonephila clavipes]